METVAIAKANLMPVHTMSGTALGDVDLDPITGDFRGIRNEAALEKEMELRANNFMNPLIASRMINFSMVENPQLDVAIDPSEPVFPAHIEKRITPEEPLSAVVASEQELQMNIPTLNPIVGIAASSFIHPSYIRVNTTTQITTPIATDSPIMSVVARAVNQAVHREFNDRFVRMPFTETTTNSINLWMNDLGTGLNRSVLPVRVTTNPYTHNESALAFGQLADYAVTTAATNNGAQIYINGVNATVSANGQYVINLDAYLDPASLYCIEKATENWAKENQIQQILAKMRSVSVLVKKNSRRNSIPMNPSVSPQEIKARETLREMITESEYRRYVTNGFIMAKGQSGIWYQIFSPQFGRPRTYKDGKPFESLCIHTDYSCPPTDHVINCKVMVEIDEESFRKGSNIAEIWSPENHDNTRPGAIQVNPDGTLVDAEKAKEESLVDTWKRLKVA